MDIISSPLKKSLCLAMCISIIALFLNIFLLSKSKDELTDMDLSNIEIINHIAITDQDSFDDLLFLRDELEGKKIVILGEAIHNDGSAIKAKARIVRFLHERADFNFLSFEAGRYDIWRLGNNPKLAVSASLPDFWATAPEMNNFWSYIYKNDIQISGFDIRCTGNINDIERRELLFSYLDKITKDDSKFIYPAFYDICDSLTYHLNRNSLSERRTRMIFDELSSIIDILKKQPKSNFNDIHIAYLSGIDSWWKCILQYDYMSRERFEIRDSLMARNVVQIKNYIDSCEGKLIIWCSNLHAFKNNQSNPNPSMDFKNLGSILTNLYPNEVYTLLFTSYARIGPENTEYNYAPTNSLEYNLHKLGHKYLYLNKLKSLDLVKTGINQYMFYPYRLSEMADGLFYIDQEIDVN